MAAAARSIGIPARITGCSQSILDDDHHWIEFFDPSDANGGPFGDSWHTKEGTSAGNEGGPFDSPSGPMNLCLKKLIAKDPARLNTIWSSAWSSQEYLPFQWSPQETRGAALSFVGGVNRCGACKFSLDLYPTGSVLHEPDMLLHRLLCMGLRRESNGALETGGLWLLKAVWSVERADPNCRSILQMSRLPPRLP